MKILAIETSCDETAISLVETKSIGKKTQFKILGNKIASQIELHAQYGGVFPMMAKREHIKNLPIVFDQVLKQAKIKIEKVDAIAVTVGPGLEPALWTGIVFAKELSEKYGIPIVPVNHMEGHIFSIFPKKGKTFIVDAQDKVLPALSLLVSGGHTELVYIKDWMKYKKIGQTRDDAAGEAFDKVARMLELPYPGGPQVSRMAHEERERAVSDITLPRPMMHTKDYDFSFSGLKTAVLYMIRDLPKDKFDDSMKAKIAREFEDAVVDVLSTKTIRAIKTYKIKNLIVGGGVSANTYLQKVLKNKIKKEKLKTTIHFPVNSLTGDNALMIAVAGYFQYKNKKFIKNGSKLKAIGNLSL